MPNFLFVYYGGKMAATPAEQKKSMDDWNKWFSNQGKAVVDMGAPTMPGKLVTVNGVKNVGRNQVTGYSVIKADSLDAAVAIAKTNPQIKSEGQIAVYECVAMM